VIIFNDDFTPVEFVIKLLVEIFNKNLKSAKDLTLEIHESGSAVAGTYSYEIAEQKCAEGTTVARGQGHPLQLKVKQVE
jgi:ATP-dependent Clp protease adaptor protein ClpS